MPKKCSSQKEVDVIENHVHIKGNLLVDGVIASRTSPQAIIVTQQKDLCDQILSSFVPILIPEGSLLTELNLNLRHLYNRHLLVQNLSGHSINLIIPKNTTTRNINLPNHRHANITIIVSYCPYLIHTVADIPTLPIQTTTCSFTTTLRLGESFAEYVELFAGRLDLILNQGSTEDFISSFIIDRGIPTIVTQRFPIGNTETIGITTLSYDINTNIISITTTGILEVCQGISRLL